MRDRKALYKRIMDQKQQFPSILLQIKILKGKLLSEWLTSALTLYYKVMLKEIEEK